MVRARRMRCIGHVAYMEELKSAFTVLAEKRKGKKQLNLDGWTVLK
jgi:hypothetical protein